MRKVWTNGSDLNDEMKAKALAMFINRDTVESPWNEWARSLTNQTGRKVPTDAEWLASKEFLVAPDGTFTGCRTSLTAASAAYENALQRLA